MIMFLYGLMELVRGMGLEWGIDPDARAGLGVWWNKGHKWLVLCVVSIDIIIDLCLLICFLVYIFF